MSDASQAIVHVASREVTAQDFQPVLNVAQVIQRKQQLNEIISSVMVDKLDYGSLPGYGKPELLKPGAEKLASMFGLSPKYIEEKIIEQWDGDEPLFFYRYTCQLWRGDRLMGEASGSCNSRESKYRYRWISEIEAKRRPDFERLPKRGGRQFEPQFAINKAETNGKYGKPAEYWQAFKDGIANGTAEKIEQRQMGTKHFDGWEIDTTVYRVPNPDICDQVNTILKIAQKRALVAAVLVVTNASDAFTQDLEDLAPEAQAEAARATADKRVAEESKKAEAAAAEPDDEPLKALYARIDAHPDPAGEAETIASIILEGIREAVGGDMSRRAWINALKAHGDPKKVKPAEVLKVWAAIIRDLYKAHCEIKARAEKQA